MREYQRSDIGTHIRDEMVRPLRYILSVMSGLSEFVPPLFIIVIEINFNICFYYQVGVMEPQFYVLP